MDKNEERIEELKDIDLQYARQRVKLNGLQLRMLRTQIRESEVALDMAEELIKWHGLLRRVYDPSLDSPILPLPETGIRHPELKPEAADFNSN